MKHLDLFSGIGAWGLASLSVWPDREMVGFVEIDDYPRAILLNRFPETPCYGDIKEFDGTKFKGIDLLTGSPPCQAASSAGKQRGKSDPRWLWPETLRVLGEVRPRWFVFENVYGLLGLDGGVAFEEVCAGMEAKGYEVWPFVLPASSVGGMHQRRRVWLVGHADSNGKHDVSKHDEMARKPRMGASYPYSDRDGIQGRKAQATTRDKRSSAEQLSGLLFAGVGSPVSIARAYRTSHGIPSRLDVRRNMALGNAIVPQVAEEIMRAIKHVDERTL